MHDDDEQETDEETDPIEARSLWLNNDELQDLATLLKRLNKVTDKLCFWMDGVIYIKTEEDRRLGHIGFEDDFWRFYPDMP